MDIFNIIPSGMDELQVHSPEKVWSDELINRRTNNDPLSLLCN